MNQPKHIPVLLGEVVELLDPGRSQSYLDLTAGYGGHAEAVLGLVGSSGRATLVDRDEQAIAHLGEKFDRDKRVTLIHEDFFSASKQLLEQGQKFDMILADLGVSSQHLDKAERGFSFREEGPLDMRMDSRQEETAADILNNANEAELIQILKEFGEVKKPRRVTQALIENRPYESTSELANTVAGILPKKGRIHPATQVFQALRIAVNQEIDQLQKSLPLWIDLLEDGGRLAIISFHSLEDRLVKQALKEQGGNRYDAKLKILTKRPITAGKNELVFNPRARSAKLRAAAKIKIKERGMHAYTGQKHLPRIPRSG